MVKKAADTNPNVSIHRMMRLEARRVYTWGENNDDTLMKNGGWITAILDRAIMVAELQIYGGNITTGLGVIDAVRQLAEDCTERMTQNQDESDEVASHRVMVSNGEVLMAIRGAGDILREMDRMDRTGKDMNEEVERYIKRQSTYTKREGQLGIGDWPTDRVLQRW